MKPARLRPLAERDLLETSHWYAERGGDALAERFFDAARSALRTVEPTPGIGSRRLGLLAGLEELRSWPVAGFPVRWFYVERSDHLDVVRLLGERQNVVRILREDES